jgi:hypothetical protein
MASQKCSFIDRDNKPLGEFEVEYLDQATANVPGARQVLPGCVAMPDGRVFMRKNENSDQYLETARPCNLIFADGKKEPVSIFQPSPPVVTKGGKTFKRLNEDLYKEVVAAAL